MDFVSDQLFNGKKFRALKIVDTFTRECLGIHIDKSLEVKDVVNLSNQININRELPGNIEVDNGSEFVSKALDEWSYINDIKIQFSRPGKPTDNVYIESFNSSFRDECLSIQWFLSIEGNVNTVCY